MNASVLLLAGAVTLAAPVGYFTVDAIDHPDAPATTTVGSAPAAPSDNLIVRIHHDGDALVATLAIGEATERVEVVEGETILSFAVDPALEPAVGLSFEWRQAWDVLGIAEARVDGEAPATFAECDVVEMLFQTYARGRDSGLTVWGAECVPGPVRHVSVESSGPSVVFPYPTCPTSCTVGYGFGGSGRLAFEVPEGTRAVEVVAHWTAESPMTEELAIWLTTPNEECGDGCWMAVAQGQGREQVSFRYDDPQPGEYALSSFFTMPVGASVRQDVWLEAVVIPS